jgi:hypothetical protein
MSRKLYLHQVKRVNTMKKEVENEFSFLPLRFQRGHIEKINLDQYNSMNSKDRSSFRYYANKQQIEIDFLSY